MCSAYPPTPELPDGLTLQEQVAQSRRIRPLCSTDLDCLLLQAGKCLIVGEVENFLAANSSVSGGVRDIAHRLKSSARTVGCADFAALCETIEGLKRESDIGLVRDHVVRLQKMFVEIDKRVGEEIPG